MGDRDYIVIQFDASHFDRVVPFVNRRR
jgi:hypothetical protein